MGTRTWKTHIMTVILFIFLTGSSQVRAQIEGGHERAKFTPGDQIIYDSRIASCPVGELHPDFHVAKGSYECARFMDRIWIRPLTMGTVLYLPLKTHLSDNFSLEFDVYAFEKGNPFLEFRAHPAEHIQILKTDEYGYAHRALFGALLSSEHEPSSFGAQDKPSDIRFDTRFRLKKGGIHHIAFQYRRGQLRLFVNGKRAGIKPFHPETSIGVLSFYFYRRYDTPVPYKDAPVLLGNITVARYSQIEKPPLPEKDLIKELHGVETVEGLRITLQEAILFESGKWNIKKDTHDLLEKLALLASLRSGPIHIYGHTDNVGSKQFNLVLSELRAYVIALELARRGVDAKRLKPQGFGETRPLVPNDSEAHRAQNRRVEILFQRPDQI